MVLDEVLERIQDTPTYSETINVISNKWDNDSKQYLANNPTLIETINDHMASGVFEQVSSAVEKERTFGRLSGLSDLEAYHQMGTRLSESGALKPATAPVTPERTVAQKRTPQTPDPKLKQKKRAASSTKTKPVTKTPDFNPLSMSDAEFEKAINENLL